MLAGPVLGSSVGVVAEVAGVTAAVVATAAAGAATAGVTGAGVVVTGFTGAGGVTTGAGGTVTFAFATSQPLWGLSLTVLLPVKQALFSIKPSVLAVTLTIYSLVTLLPGLMRPRSSVI